MYLKIESMMVALFVYKNVIVQLYVSYISFLSTHLWYIYIYIYIYIYTVFFKICIHVFNK